MAGESNTSTLTGLYKIVYGKLLTAVGDDTKFLRDLSFVGGAEGEQYQNAIVTSVGDGFTNFGSKYTTATTLGLSTSEVVEKQIFTAVETFYQGRIIINAISYALSSAGAFKKATKNKFLADKASMDNRKEFETIYGRSGISLGTQSGKSSSSGLVTLDLPDAEYFTAIRRFYNHLVVAKRTADGTTSDDNNAVYRIRGISGGLGSYTISLQEINTTTGANVTDNTNGAALATAIASNAQSLYFYNSIGAAVTYEPLGVVAALSTTTGNLWNIAVSNPNYGPRPLTISGAPALSQFEDVAERAIEGGFSSGRLNVYISHKRWSQLVKNDKYANVAYNDNNVVSGVTGGTDEYDIRSQEGVKMRIIPTPFVKNGDIIALPTGDWERKGTNDWTQVVNDMGSMFLWNGGNAYQYAHQTIQAPFCTKVPARSVYARAATLS